MWPLISALVVALVGIWTTQWLQWIFRQRRFRHEKLIEKYSELVAAASAEIDRARSLEAGIALGRKEGDHTELTKLDLLRHDHRREFSRLAYQIRMLEPKPEFVRKIDALIKAQPGMAFAVPAQWGEGNFDQRFEKFKDDIATFERLLSELVDMLQSVYAAVHPLSLETKEPLPEYARLWDWSWLGGTNPSEKSAP